MREAELYRKVPDGAVSCFLCQNRCYIPQGNVGKCHVRKNIGGTLYAMTWGKCAAYEVDPIEKKPFYHFMPGSSAFSFATVGCNFSCLHCQNWGLSQPSEIFGQDILPKGIVKLAQAYKSQGIAYTYTEPTIFFEYAKDTAIIARKKNLYNVFVTNGYQTPETIEVLTFLDASRIDLKGFTEKFYKDICGNAHLEPVLDAIKLTHRKMHIEIITLLIPTLNDSDEEIRALSKWIRELDADIPLHFTAYYPANKMTIPPTPVETLGRARKIALEEGLKYVYTGNRPGDEGENTYCPKCGEKVISRVGMEMVENKLVKGNQCPVCKTKLPIVFDWKKSRKD